MDVSSPTIAMAATPADRMARHSAERLAGRLAWVILAMVSVVAALTFRDYGLGWDDFTHAQYGELLLSLYTSGLHDTRALSFVNLYLYGGGFDMAAALLAKNKNPSREQIVQHMNGNICRCGTYNRIIGAIQRAAKDA